MGIKLPAARVNELLEKPDFVPFQPFGRNRGKEFVQINHDNPEDYRHDLALFEELMQFVLTSASGQKASSAVTHQEEQRFSAIVERLTHEHSDIMLGKMMSSPAIQHQGKVFAFFYNKRWSSNLDAIFSLNRWE